MTKKSNPRKKEITIARGGRVWSERTMMVYRWRQAPTRIDPQVEYFLGTGKVLSRHCCMISFMAGLSAAGFIVYVNDYRTYSGPLYRKPAKHTTFKPVGVYVPEYMKMGRLWALNQWDAHTAKTRQRGLSVGTLVDLGIWR